MQGPIKIILIRCKSTGKDQISSIEVQLCIWALNDGVGNAENKKDIRTILSSKALSDA